VPSNETGRIHRLPPEVAGRIAAGEVVERPSNACKELVENALDAGARRIVVEMEAGGKVLLRVRDDGCGMSAGDAVLALQRHATSKLAQLEDLQNIQTLGFRGEALPSIAAVSKLELVTREHGAEAGTKLIVEGGEIKEASETGCVEGTEITVRQMLYNTPARFKFLKSDAAEAARINELIGQMALANPHVSFLLTNNGSEMTRVDAAGDGFNAVVSVLGRDTARQMLPLDESSESGIRVHGFAGRPQLTRANRNAQITFVNGRMVKSNTIQHAILAAYEGLLHGHRRFPVAILFLQVPSSMVDVNVHPSKNEVRFARDWEIHHAVRSAIRATLSASQLAPEWNFEKDGGGAKSTFREHGESTFSERGHGVPAVESIQPRHGGRGHDGDLRGYSYKSTFNTPLPEIYPPHSHPAVPAGGDISQFHQSLQQMRAQENVPEQSSLPEMPPSIYPERLQLRPLGQIQQNAYILCEGGDGLYIVSQHRAHERILADRALEAAQDKPLESQHLVIPLTVEVGPRALAALDENHALLKTLGFDVEAFGGNSVLVRAVPALLRPADYETAFNDLLDELISGQGGKNLADRKRHLLITLACRNALKAGDPLSAPQIDQLLKDMLQLSNYSICPHGQPILVKISSWELNKKFEREYASRR
jgi:DNA mismatch repair protein MutL